MRSQYYTKHQQTTIQYLPMQQLEVFATTPFFTNVAMNRGTISAIELHERVLHVLTQGVAIFTFLKADGVTTRHAIGTLNPALIPSKAFTMVGSEAGVSLLIGALVEADKMISLMQAGGGQGADNTKKIEAIRQRAYEYKAVLDKLNTLPKERKLDPTLQNFFDIQSQSWKSYKIDNLLALILTEGE